MVGGWVGIARSFVGGDGDRKGSTRGAELTSRLAVVSSPSACDVWRRLISLGLSSNDTRPGSGP